ncbi:MAG: SDR family oxidoreductase [Candidatus Eremiobacteraeota bacterium]|nr:SDR family oxidoreductase [Candidatus Eremiobacteraeota bacterium]MBV8722856.1 SDR family oxidoreductase [Candidatus Eremiobacteraeota bacterium]
MNRATGTRRTFVGVLGSGIAAAAAANARPAIAQTQPAPAPAVPEEYPKPPYPDQSQPWPGLAAKMSPRPDHGEKTYRGTGRLRGRKALVTGADSGIGRAVAIAFAREGADVALNYLPAEEPDAREVVQLIREAGRKAVALPGDIRSEAFCRQLVDEAAKQLGGLDTLVNVAGRQHAVKSIADLTTEEFDWTFKTNVYAMFWITKAALEHMQAGAAIVNTSSEQGYDPSPWLLDYAQTKAAIANFTKALAKQLAEKGIRVNAIAPGPFWTPLQVSGGRLPGTLAEFGETVPLHRAGQPVEIAPAYVALAAGDMSFATGQIYGVSGGNGIPG